MEFISVLVWMGVLCKRKADQRIEICIDLKGWEDILPYGLVVRILAFHAGGPGSIPGVGNFFLL